MGALRRGDGRAERLRVQPPARHRAGGVTSAEQQHFATGIPQAPGEHVDDQLGAAVHRWRHRHPRRRDQPDAQPCDLGRTPPPLSVLRPEHTHIQPQVATWITGAKGPRSWGGSGVLQYLEQDQRPWHRGRPRRMLATEPCVWWRRVAAAWSTSAIGTQRCVGSPDMIDASVSEAASRTAAVVEALLDKQPSRPSSSIGTARPFRIGELMQR